MANTANMLAQNWITEHSFEQFAPLNLPALERLFPSGLARGILGEIHGNRSSGRTAMCLNVLAQATACGECCAIIDSNDSFHPASASVAGVDLARLVWIRCQGNVEHAMRATDLILHAGGFGVIALDLCDATARVLSRIPLSYWYRFRRAIENTQTILLILAPSAQAKSATASVKLETKTFAWSGKPPFETVRTLSVQATLAKSPTADVKPLADGSKVRLHRAKMSFRALD